jgi:hypothetical protein
MNVHKLENPQQAASATRMEASQASSLAKALSRILHNEPNLEYMIPDDEARRNLSPLFFLSAIRVGQLYGEIRMTDNEDGVAVWIRPEYGLPFRRLVRVGLMGSPFDEGWESTVRYMKLGASVEEVRKHVAPDPHWYLLVAGAEASCPEKRMAENLIEPVLSRANSGRTACYLETFSEQSLTFYKQFGFRIVGAGRIPDGGPNFWAMTRAAET